MPACNQQQVPFAYRMYTRTDEIGWAQSTAFKKAFSMDVDIEFIGVWDTVSSVGMIPKRLPFTTSCTAVKTFRHAVRLPFSRAICAYSPDSDVLDEHRRATSAVPAQLFQPSDC